MIVEETTRIKYFSVKKITNLEHFRYKIVEFFGDWISFEGCDVFAGDWFVQNVPRNVPFKQNHNDNL